MQPQRSDTDESLLTLKGDPGNNERNTSTPVQVHREWSDPILTALSPRPAPKSPQSSGPKSSFRPRSDSGLAWTTNQAPFRRSAHGKPDSWLSAWSTSATVLSDEEENSSEADHASDHPPITDLKGLVLNGQVLPDFFEPAVIDLVLSNPDTVRRLRAFAQIRHTGSDIDFLSKVEEYSHALEEIIGFMTHISQHFTGSMATSPLELTPDVAGALKSNVKYCTRAALPALDKVYREARATAQERLSRNLYPEFVKYQLSQCLTASLSTHFMFGDQLRHRYPGLGEAFCLTDPLRPDNPIVCASDGFLSMSGYPRRDLIGKNCRLLQGPGTDPEAIRRLSQAAAAGKPVTELLLNYKPDGAPYWNLLFICPLMERGNVRYSLGAQINVSENMGSDYEDILGILNFGHMPGQLSSPRMDPPGSPHSSARLSSEHLDPDDLDDQHGGEQRTSRRRRFLRHFHRRSPSSRASSHSRRSTASVEEDSSPPPTVPSPQPAHPPPFASERLEHHFTLPYPYSHQEKQLHIDEQSTPYSRFFVLRFTNPHPPSVSANYLNSPHRASVSPHRRARGTSGSGSDRSGGSASSGDPIQKQRLPIAFCSPHALSLLGIKLQPHHESNPSAVVADIHRGGTGFLSQVLMLGGAGAGVVSGPSGKRALKRVVSSWVPLKDGVGRVGWVVLVLTPVGDAL
ncbi:uncharacterized protein C8A04DRAFT_35316 [Dichotomopilus funicola]|uniref:LOV domain-containing protein n=1 Tax=Dichotomopilus funicola TaxID=1934379 RepID=A0AAN6V8N7_9PEZI|nr:hypothetical protein C8A04DRAFT_35316 [Dichotomopilus funicola]